VLVVMDERVLAGEVTVLVFDRGAEPAWREGGGRYRRWQRYEAELEGFAAVRELGVTPWEAVHRLVLLHRGLLERRWSACM
jgi:hypothetical protein